MLVGQMQQKQLFVQVLKKAAKNSVFRIPTSTSMGIHSLCTTLKQHINTLFVHQ